MTVTYEDIDENGEPLAANTNKMMKKSLEPKTDLQRKLFAIQPGVKRFPNTHMRARWRKLEAKATGASDEARLFHAWLAYVIEQTASKNKPRVTRPYTAAISWAENEEWAAIWIADNRERVLKKKTASEMMDTLREAELIDAYLEEE